MPLSRCLVAVAVTLAAVVWQGFSVADAAESNQATQPQLSAPAHGSARNAVVIGWAGPLDHEQAAALQSLIESELAGHQPDRIIGLYAVRGAAGVWIAGARRNPRALLVALLELRVSGAWRIYLVDAARNRAIVRDLPGEAAGNSAALESVASVVSSAVRALDEGLEIASRPLTEVVGVPARRTATRPHTNRCPRRSPRALRWKRCDSAFDVRGAIATHARALHEPAPRIAFLAPAPTVGHPQLARKLPKRIRKFRGATHASRAVSGG